MTLTVRVVRALTLALLAAPLAASGQPAARPARLGILYANTPAFAPDSEPCDRALVTGLRAEGSVVGQHVVIEFRSALGTDLALKHGVPMVFPFRSQAEAGGLMSYTTDLGQICFRAGSLAARILQGAKPADLPVEEPTKYQPVVNLKTAKALGLTLPSTVLARADEVIH